MLVVLEEPVAAVKAHAMLVASLTVLDMALPLTHALICRLHTLLAYFTVAVSVTGETVGRLARQTLSVISKPGACVVTVTACRTGTLLIA